MKRMKKLLVFLLVAVMALPIMAAPAKAMAAELTAAEILGKIEEGQKALKSYDETFEMEFGVRMKGMGQLVNIKLDGTATEFAVDGNPVKAKASVAMDIKLGKAIKPMIEQYGFKAGTYEAESYVIANGTAWDIYAKADVPTGENMDWVKTNITEEQMANLLIQYGINEATSPSVSITDFTDAFTVKEEGNTYVIDGDMTITQKMITDSVKQSGELDKMTKKEKKKFNKVIKKLSKNLKPIKINMVVDKETLVPVSQTVDFNAYCNSILKAALTMDKKDKEMVKMSKNLTITGCTVKSEISNINSAADFTLPADAAAAQLIPFEELMGSVSGLN